MLRATATITAALAVAITLSGFAGSAPGETPPGRYCAVDVRTPNHPICAESPVGLNSARDEAARLQQAAEVTPQAQVLIATLYDNAGYDTNAGYLDIYAGAGCSPSKSSVDFSMSNLSTWSGRVSSFESFGSCAMRLWSGTGFTGSAYPSSTSFIVNSTYVGAAMNDKARSLQLS